MSGVAKDVDEYLAGLPGEQRVALQKLRETIRSTAPEATESISYKLPAYKYKGRPLIYFGAARNHCAVYAIDTDLHKDELVGFDMSKGTVRFSPDKPLPEALVRELVTAKIEEIERGVKK